MTILPAVVAAEQFVPSFNLYGAPGLVDMPSANTAPDATLSTTFSRFGDNSRTTLTFQLTPRISGSFRYAAIRDFVSPASVNGVYYDRSFDVRFLALRESDLWPGVVLGFQDMIGTGLYGGEYIVATKTLAPGLEVTGGVGWGRFGTRGWFARTGTRPTTILGAGGVPTYDRWFRGRVAAFGGLAFSPNDRLTLKAEYSSDNYETERSSGRFSGTSPWNFGLDWRGRRGGQFSLYYAYGEEIGAQFTFHLNPKRSPIPGGVDPAPIPVVPRAPGSSRDLGWTTDENVEPAIRTALANALERDGLEFEGFSTDGRRAVLRIRNDTYLATPQAVGRSMRIMSRVLPASVEEFVVIPVSRGMGMAAVSQTRSDIERLENAPSREILARTRFGDAYGLTPPLTGGGYPKFTWSLTPYLQLSVFDPQNPARADAGLRATARYEFIPGVVVSGSVTKRAVGNLNAITRPPGSTLPLVRTNFARFKREGDPALEHFTLAGYARLGPDLYGRATVGYLEPMYAGVSGEVLWKPVDSRLALGLELNAVRQRAFDQRFGLQSCDFLRASANFKDCTILTGHASAYYDLGNGFHGQLDVGRYLAGDYGATISLDREFANGWRVGAYATFTDVTASDFGEGSFDKGIRVTVPLGWLTGKSSRRTNTVKIQSLTRDGGARLDVGGRLYERVREYHQPNMAKTWGRFWR